MLSIYLSEGNVPGVLEIVKEFRDNSYKPEERPFRDIIKVHLLVRAFMNMIRLTILGKRLRKGSPSYFSNETV